MSGVHPVVRYLILCEDVSADAGNPSRITLAGLLSKITSRATPPFPLLFPEICVFLQLTECRGSAAIRVELVHADTGQVEFRTPDRTIPFGNDPLALLGLTFRLKNLLFPVAGLYWVQFCYNDAVIAQQPLLLEE
jgi:hypothetical protein